VPLPEGADPDDVVKQGKDVYQKCLDDAMPLIDFKIHYAEQKYDLSDTTEKRRFLGEALKIVSEAESESVKEELLKKLRDKTGITYNALEKDLRNVQKGGDEPVISSIPVQRIVETDTETDKSVKAKRFILAAKLFSAPYAKDFNLREIDFADETQIVVADYVCQREADGERIRPSELFEVLDENCRELNKILDFNYEDKLSGEVAERFFADSVKALMRERIETEIAKCNREYAETTDEEKRRALAKQLAELIKEKNRLKRN
jgi:DNA primase